MNQDGENGGEINEARWREAQVGTITRLNQVISTLTDRMERIEIALGNLQGREVLLNEGVENEEDDNVTLLAGHSPRGGRDVGPGRGRVRRRCREMLAPKRIEREYQYEREKEKGVGGVKLKIPTFYGRFLCLELACRVIQVVLIKPLVE